jgi:hypothetical protein
MSLDHSKLRQLADANKWTDIIDATDVLRSDPSSPPGIFFFRATGLAKVGRIDDALSTIESGLTRDANSAWGNKLLFDTLRAAGRVPEAYSRFAEYIRTPGNHEADKAWLIQCAAEANLFDVAAEVNESRAVIANVPVAPQYALAVQCFCKADTLDQVFASLCSIEGAEHFALVILQDSPIGSPREQEYRDEHKAVKSVFAQWLSNLSHAFFSVEFIENVRNLGTAPSCRRLLDYVSRKYAGFLFIEDDCVLSPFALNWARYHLSNTIRERDTWFVTCESSFFDREDRVIDPDLSVRLSRFAERPDIRNAYVFLKFVPSTCFGTVSGIWQQCAIPRSFTRGPESLNRFLQMKQKQTIAPVVPRAADIGMLHRFGYSVEHVGTANVKERKNTFHLSQTAFEPADCLPYDGDKDVLYRATSLLDLSALDSVDKPDRKLG